LVILDNRNPFKEIKFVLEMKIEYSHNKPKEEAYEKISTLLNELQKKYTGDISNPQMSWNETKDKMNFSVSIRGANISGEVYLQDKRIILDGKLPFLARMFSGQIEGRIRKELEALLA